ncbi:MAG: hypothetical protein UV82_C0009G0050 [Candidatus Magasanikbacteria bacterium GW2011_GWD2_43_18]|uniref:Uncharacterized protein n=1 Tax=Candidatus Magasanikbacteria bacterium GW2011_GWE2_42_7 TaxID=1619052 RepID=A0A0G1EBI6_9BACT|nr:MAG: hypothetical protein UV18_C0004G0134 [Candidatus Magasanikbacteria bacterium GW2011_GWC2_42_27]KKS71963.1 MAG: hypothetical protein UV42_C0016G0012 [Candidatus Magasanikbacteria bacterium GW2011_GWE2_42_7]KKT04311.1 MAG: hypothetical protein UV82_C0009G0050 [Candidatus Magasanikbacteria bacterium GW2011_GWD2_43_18]KKT24295.1 MAG: hypothetical protein UW10_C0030G0011 [Candidatus Magasanikbacteria bacterium GW2011_GWA2_43_9]
MTVKAVNELREALRYAEGKCDVVLASGLPYDSSIDNLADFLAHLFEQGGNDLPLREWFRALEEQTFRKLIENGAKGADLDRYLGMKKSARQQYLYRRFGIAVTKLGNR